MKISRENCFRTLKRFVYGTETEGGDSYTVRPVAIPSYPYYVWYLIEIFPCDCLVVLGVVKDKACTRVLKCQWFIMNWSH